jgi:LacI family transcriptional regulator
MICGPSGNGDAADRLLGFHQALAAYGLASELRLELPGDFSEEAGLRAGERLAALTPLPTAVFAANDAMAIGCLAALRSRGLRVPDDLSLVGFDDIPIARYLTPALTTVQVPIAEIGGRALDRLVAVMQGVSEPKHEVIEPTLAIRASTAAPRETVIPFKDRRRNEP